MVDAELSERARALLDLCRRKKLKIAAAESCTGGLLAATLTEIANGGSRMEDRRSPFSILNLQSSTFPG